MKNERKIAVLEKRLAQCRSEIEQLDAQNAALKRENNALQREVESWRKTAEVACAGAELYKSTMESISAELMECKHNYIVLYDDMAKLKTKYKKEMDALLSRLRKQK